MRTPYALKRHKFGPLEAIDSGGEKGALTVVMFHGYGADAADLATLAQEIDAGRPLRWVFPDAPVLLDFGGRAWFPIDVESVQEAQSTGKPVDWSDSEPAMFSQARTQASEFLKALGVPWKDLILGGFSQGGILAADLALRAPESPKALVILSGNLVAAKEWRELAPKRAGLPFFQSHGIADPILGYQGARKLEALLKESGLSGKLLSFEGGHGITPEVAQSLRQFLASL